MRWKRKVRRKFSQEKLLNNLLVDRSSYNKHIKIFLLCLFFLFMTIAIVNPQRGGKLKTFQDKSSDILFIVDVSKSMLCNDITPSRLEKAKQIVSKAIDYIGGSDRVGIIIYAGSAYPLLPITSDYDIAKTYLNQIDTDMISSMGTSIGDALDMSDKYFDIEDKAGKIIFILSDGEDHDNVSLENHIQKKLRKGINIFTFGVGTEKGGPIPMKINNKILDYKKDKKGNIVITKLNSNTLTKIANFGKGKYMKVGNTSTAVNFIIDTVKKAEKRQGKSEKLIDYEDLFKWFLLISIFILFIESILFENKGSYKKIIRR